MTPKELKNYLQKEIIKVRAREGTMFLCDEIDCCYHSLESFIRDRSTTGTVPVSLKIICYFINHGLIVLKGGVKNV